MCLTIAFAFYAVTAWTKTVTVLYFSHFLWIYNKKQGVLRILNCIGESDVFVLCITSFMHSYYMRKRRKKQTNPWMIDRKKKNKRKNQKKNDGQLFIAHLAFCCKMSYLVSNLVPLRRLSFYWERRHESLAIWLEIITKLIKWAFERQETIPTLPSKMPSKRRKILWHILLLSVASFVDKTKIRIEWNIHTQSLNHSFQAKWRRTMAHNVSKWCVGEIETKRSKSDEIQNYMAYDLCEHLISMSVGKRKFGSLFFFFFISQWTMKFHFNENMYSFFSSHFVYSAT